MSLRAVIFPLSLAFLLVACTRSGPRLAGAWAPDTAELGGQPLPVAAFNGAILHLTDSTYDFGNDTGAVALLPPSTPAMMDVTGRAGPNAGRVIPAIYQLGDSSLTIAYQLGTGPRPTAFAPAKGTQELLVRYRRMP
jgi:uncharacterized protein (TIGR03067 family)